MKTYKTLSLKTIFTLASISILSMPLSTASAAVSNELSNFNAQWPEAFNTKNVTAVQGFYDQNSLLTSIPYKPEAGLKGAKAIGNMFKSGPFNLDALNVEVVPLGFEENADVALLLKNWKVSHSGGAFSGLAIEVLEKTTDGWKRSIDAAATGFSTAQDFAKQATIEQSFVSPFTVEQTQTSQLNSNHQNKQLNTQIKNAISTGQYKNISSIVNQNNGLLIARVNVEKNEYITFNALVKQQGKWRLQVQLFSVL